MRATELTWSNSATFKRFDNDLPIAQRCVLERKPGAEIKVRAMQFQYYSSCQAYKGSDLGAVANCLDAPTLMNVGGNVGKCGRACCIIGTTAIPILGTAQTKNSFIWPTDRDVAVEALSGRRAGENDGRG